MDTVTILISRASSCAILGTLFRSQAVSAVSPEDVS